MCFRLISRMSYNVFCLIVFVYFFCMLLNFIQFVGENKDRHKFRREVKVYLKLILSIKRKLTCFVTNNLTKNDKISDRGTKILYRFQIYDWQPTKTQSS